MRTALLRLGAAAGMLAVPSFAGAQGFLIPPPNTNGRGWHGWSVAGIPDVTGDGRGELAIGATGARTLDEFAGGVQVYSGGTGMLIRTLNSPDREFHGRFGWAVAHVPDTNSDGWADIAVGSPREEQDGTPRDSGRAYVYSGRTGQLLRAFRSAGVSENGWFGSSIAGIADLNGDGRGDVIVGAPREDPGEVPKDAGRVYVFSGATGARLRTLVSPAQSDGEQFGFAVASIGDVSGDGKPDILVGAPQMRTDDTWYLPPIEQVEGPGRVYVYSGATGQLLRVIHGAEDDSGFGRCVSGVPDVNGDGRPDIAIGAPWQDQDGHENAGRAFVYSGATGVRLRSLLPPVPKSDGFFGFSIAGLADVTGDGRGDVAVGARHEGEDGEGQAHVYSGASGQRVRTLYPGFAKNDDRDGFGSCVAAVPNRNARPSILVGAPFNEWDWDGDEWDWEGMAYLFGN